MKKLGRRLYAFLLALSILVALPQPAQAQAVRLNRATLDLYTGYSAPLILKNAENVKWSTSDKAVAKVSAKGIVTAVDEGSCTVRAFDKDTKKTYTCSVKVKRKAFSLCNTMGTAKKEGTVYSLNTLKNYIKSELGDTIGSDVKWSTSDESIVCVTDQQGLCALDFGTVVLTAEMSGKTYIYELTITEEEPAEKKTDSLKKTNSLKKTKVTK